MDNRTYLIAREKAIYSEKNPPANRGSKYKKHFKTYKVKTPSPRVNEVGENAVKIANRKSIQSARSSSFINSIMTFDYVEGDLYRIYTAPLCVTDIEFQSAEHIISVAAGDTLRWQVSKTYSGAGINRQEHLFVKPFETGLTNSVVVTTDVRTYHLILCSTQNTFMAEVAWHYPQEDGLLDNSGAEDDIGGSDYTHPIDIDHVNFRYQIKLIRGPKPDWFPSAVFNDGKKTYIKFPANAQEAPTLFIGNGPKTNQMVNYRVQGNYYVVDNVFSAAQLHSGYNSAIIVQITYEYKR